MAHLKVAIDTHRCLSKCDRQQLRINYEHDHVVVFGNMTKEELQTIGLENFKDYNMSFHPARFPFNDEVFNGHLKLRLPKGVPTHYLEYFADHVYAINDGVPFDAPREIKNVKS